MKRLNRHLAKIDQQIFRCKVNSQWHANLGNYYVIDINRNALAIAHVDIEKFARDEGVLKFYEEVS